MRIKHLKFEKLETNELSGYLVTFLQGKRKAYFCFTGRAGGYSKGDYDSLNLSFRQGDDGSIVKKNWRKLLNTLSLPLFVLSPEQIHGNSISFVDDSRISLKRTPEKFSITVYPGVDGLLVSRQLVPVAALFADCIPVTIVDYNIKIAGVLHAGWRGTFDNISDQAVKLISKSKNIDPSDLFAVIGPGIGPCCYETGNDLLKKFGDYPEALENVPVPRIDLKKINRMQLIRAGLNEKRIFDIDICTSCNTDYFSHRRDKGKTGRQAAIAWIE